MPGCPFCMIVRGDIEAEVVLEDDRTLSFMDINPIADGHALVVPKAHARDLHAIAGEDLQAVVVSAQRVAAAVQRAVRPGGLNLLQANGPAAGQSVPHFHMHIVPRHEGDDLKLCWEHKPGDRDRIAEIAAAVRKCV